MENRADRAKIFMPFNPLKGFQEALWEKEKMVIPKAQLTDERVEEIDQKLKCIEPGEMVTVIFYRDGRYDKITGCVSECSETAGTLTVGNTVISFEDIYHLV